MKRVLIVVLSLVLLLGFVMACGGTEDTGGAQLSKPCEPTMLAGRGDDIVDVSGVEGCTRVVYTHKGESNFIVKPYDSSNELMSGFINEVGDYAGTSKWNQRTASLEITADGSWTINISK